MKLLYIVHYGHTSQKFYCHSKTRIPLKIIGDGGANIHIHLISFFVKKQIKIEFSTYENNYQLQAFFKNKAGVKFDAFPRPYLRWFRYSFLIDNFYKSLILPFKALFLKKQYDSVVSATDFFPDVIYAFLVKMRNPKIKWIASYFLEAPKPWAKINPYRTSLKRYAIGVFYWFIQKPSYSLIKKRADFVLVTSKPDVERFVTSKREREKIIVVKGGVDTIHSKNYLKSKRRKPISKRKYDACFVGRFHYQKGVLELVDIWHKVCQRMPQARLAMIGNGPLEAEVRKRIKKNHLERNIDLLGFMNGQDKFAVFKDCKIMVHPATYDSGGMAAAEGLAWGLPGVSFNLKALKTYYPYGMIKTPEGDLEKFADNILKLLGDSKFYQTTSRKAVRLIENVWDWRVRADKIYKELFNE